MESIGFPSSNGWGFEIKQPKLHLANFVVVVFISVIWHADAIKEQLQTYPPCTRLTKCFGIAIRSTFKERKHNNHIQVTNTPVLSQFSGCTKCTQKLMCAYSILTDRLYVRLKCFYVVLSQYKLQNLLIIPFLALVQLSNILLFSWPSTTTHTKKSFNKHIFQNELETKTDHSDSI